MLEKIMGKYKNIIIIAGIVGIGMIFLSSFLGGNSGSSKEETKAVNTNIPGTEYTDKIESNLTEMISKIDGAGEPKVLVTLENGAQTEYATEKKTDSQTAQDKKSGKTETTYITVKDKDGSEKAIPITEYAPKVRGVVVVCSGGENPLVKQRIINSVTTALNIPSSHVCVTK